MKYYELSPYQKNIMDMEQACPGTSIGNVGGLVIWRDKPEFEEMQQVYTLMFTYQRVIRLQLNRQGMLYEVECPERVVEYVDRIGMGEIEARKEAVKWFREPFELVDSPLYQVRYIDLGDTCFIGVKFHHLIADGVVIAYMERWQEMDGRQRERYIGRTEDEYINQLEHKNFISVSLQQKAKNYFTSVIPKDGYTWLLKTPCKNPEASRITFPMKSEDINDIREYANKNNITIENIIFAALAIYICTIKSTRQAAIGRVMANRTKKQMRCAGIYANTLPVFLEINEDITFGELCRICAKKAYEVQKYGRYSYHQLMVDFRLNRNLYDVSVSYRNFSLMPVGEKSYGEELFCGYSEGGLRFFIDEWRETFELKIQYRNGDYTESQAVQIGKSLIYIIRQGFLGMKIKDIKIVTPDWQKLLRKLHAAEPIVTVKGNGILEEIHTHVEKTPNKVCVGYSSDFYTYSQVWQMSKSVEKELRLLRIREGDKVLVYMDRNELLIPVLLGILLSGGAFLPVKREKDTKWLERVKKDCDYFIEESKGEACGIGYSIKKIGGEKCRKKGIAYYMFTSGTTGFPKAVMISMRSLYIRLKWMEREYGCEEWTLQKTNLTFDVSVWELFLPLITGNSVYLLEQGEEKRSESISDAIDKHNIGLMHFVPSMLNVFVRYAEREGRKFQGVKRVICSGEPLSEALADMAYNIFPNAELCNFYGPTECTIDVSHTVVKRGERITIGKPVANTRILICNKDKKALPTGWMGEICIVGDLVGEGYDGEEGQGGFLEIEGERAYFTGDYGMVREDGNIVYMGRLDSQCKVRGIRVDTGIIEQLLLKIPQIRQAAVVVVNNQLAAYYGAKSQLKNINRELQNYLPIHQLPQVYIWMPALPVTSNGKVDRELLRIYAKSNDNQSDWKKEKSIINKGRKSTNKGQYYGQLSGYSPTEYILEEIIGRYAILSTNEGENFCERGLDSLAVLQILEDLKSKGISVEYEDFFRTGNISGLAEIIEKREGSENSVIKPLIWFSKNNKKTLLLGVPYGGGDGGVFYKLSRNLCGGMDVAALSMSAYKRDGVVSIAQKIVKSLHDEEKKMGFGYECYCIMGVCVGSAVAIEIAGMLEKMGKKTVLILGAALVQRGIPFGNRVISYWDFMTDAQVKKCIASMQQQKYNVSDIMVNKFRRDVRRYLIYMRNTKSRKFHGECLVIFGKKDKFLRGYKRKKNIWEVFLERNGKKVHYVQIENGGHYFVGENAAELSDIVRRVLC